MSLKVAILGGGINGVCCGVQIAEFYGPRAKVEIISKDFTPNTTGDGSAGLWGPYLSGKTSPQKMLEWSKHMSDFCRDLWRTGDGGKAGICLVPVLRVTIEDKPIETFWKDIVYGYQDLTKEELEMYSKEHKTTYTSGAYFVTFTSEPAKLLPYLMKRFEAANGEVLTRNISNLSEFVSNCDYDVIINCTGLGSQKMVPDAEMYPIRGQVMRVQAPWMYYVFLNECCDGNYIIPNCDSVVLGGTRQINDFNTQPYKEDTDFITLGCHQVVPGLSNADVLLEWVGLRPGRPSVRLESEIADNGKLVIHNYGHGGCGVTLAWGCAKNVLDLVKTKSKL